MIFHIGDAKGARGMGMAVYFCKVQALFAEVTNFNYLVEVVSSLDAATYHSVPGPTFSGVHTAEWHLYPMWHPTPLLTTAYILFNWDTHPEY